MNKQSVDNQEVESRTKWAYIGTRLLDTPFWGLFNMLPFILYKDLRATAFQLACLVTLKPLVSILSSYLSSFINQRSDRIRKNILFFRPLASLPFFLFPFISNPWFYIASFSLYMMVAVGLMPAWIELLKLNLPKQTREKVFSYTQAFGYLGGGLLPFILGWALDDYHQAWRWLFPCVATLSLAALILQWRIEIPARELSSNLAKGGLSHHLLKPWKSAWELLKVRPDFRKFQLGFMLIGAGLMILQPALPIFFVDKLHLSYTELAIALTLCKGLGFALASPLGAKWINKLPLFKFSALLAALATLFPLLLLLAHTQILWIYLGYFLYGFMQSGNELSWNMSGPLFARHEDSTVYSSVNVMAVGVRGAFIPILGAWLISLWGSSTLMWIGGGLCLSAALFFYLSSVKREVLEVNT